MGDAVWVRLKRFNDWGYEYFAEPGKGLSKQGTSDARRFALPFKAGMELNVRWPDGSISRERVILQKHRQTVSDMGRPYDVTTPLPGVFAEARGVRSFVPLDGVDVDARDLPTPSEREERGVRGDRG